ncbi:M48 family metalloprotease [Bernardetia sp.]|uniref:M48 family metalloprotease n=1 Tax=Bernardetia sp. TaxID=1937974 RepID=UPI0025C12B48|nr:M48 family metalloprotease [Bernardetia sp.]
MTKIKSFFSLSFLFGLLLILGACDKDGNINFFSIEEDINIGQQVAAELEADSTVIILDESEYSEAYSYIRNLTSKVLASNDIRYRDEFVWQVKIIQDDETLNAFCAPGGYIYVYTGIIKYLDTEDQLAGVMGHEIAHADKRHVTDNLTKAYGYETLFAIFFGNDQGQLAGIAKGLINLSYGRAAEREADDFSVLYLCDTEYQSNGAAGFFQKIINEGQSSSPPEFLSTHPNPDNRVEAINNKAREEGCSITPSGNNYAAFKASLPE